MSDRLNAVSMAKVQRLLQQGHDEWYVERRDLYQTLLYDAHTSAAGSSSSQRGILSFARAAGTYTPSHRPVSSSVCSGPEARAPDPGDGEDARVQGPDPQHYWGDLVHRRHEEGMSSIEYLFINIQSCSI